MPVPGRRSRNVVLRPEVQPAEVRALAERLNWEFYAQIESDPERGIFYEVRWDTPNGGTAHYIVDEVVDAVYLVARHDDRDAADRVAAEVADGLVAWSLEELLDEFDVNVYPAGWRAALLRLGVGAPVDEDDEFALRIRESVGHKGAEVRRAAVWAMVYTEWATFRELLQSMASDPSPEVAEAAGRAAQLFDR
jgi:hypothetical protein